MSIASTYAYRARDLQGEPVTGTLSAETPEGAVAQLRGDGLIVTGIRDASVTAQVEA